METNLKEALEVVGIQLSDANSPAFSGVTVVKGHQQSFSSHYRSQWFKPEYSFSDIESAQDTDSFLSQSLNKRTLKFRLAGYNFSGENTKTVEYIRMRIKQLEIASNKPFDVLLDQTAHDLFRYYNAMWIFSRDIENSGGKPYQFSKKLIKPISAIFAIAFDSIEFATKDSGDLVKVRQVVPGATKRPEWQATDVLHFYMNRRPGYTVGSPILFPALEDIILLRRIEENVEELIEANLFPLFHYKIGTKEAPERINPKTGLREAEEIAQTLQYMPSSGVYISDWRHEITAVGSEGRALRIDTYLSYFKSRVFSALGVSPVDMGESDTSNRSTAQTQSESLTQSVESVQAVMKSFIDHYLITPLLMESSFAFDVLAPENIVEIEFGKTNISEQVLMHNNAVQLYTNNAITHEEFRNKIGKRPLKQEGESSLFYNKFPDRMAMAKIEQLKAGDIGSTQAQNKSGVVSKKTPAKKDSKYLMRNDLIEKWNKFALLYDQSEDQQLLVSEWKKEFSDRIYALYSNRVRAVVLEKDLHEELDSIYLFKSKAEAITDDLIKNLNIKMDYLHNTGVGTKYIFSTLDWRIRKIEEDIDKLYDNLILMESINLDFLEE